MVDPATGVAANTAVTIATAAAGTVVINPDGSYEYTPAAGFTGEDTFQYIVADENGNTDTAEVSIEMRDLNGATGNTPPIATDDSFTSFADATLAGSVMSNDTDPDGDVISIADVSGEPATATQTIATTAGGTVTLNTDGTFTYTPSAGFIGEDSFDYTIVDPSGATDAASVTLNVAPDDPNNNNKPNAGDDLIAGTKNEPATANLLANDTDPEADSLIIAEVNGQDPSAGSVTIVDPLTGNTAGTLTVDPLTGEAIFTPADDFVGSVQIPYTVDDGSGNTDTATITVSVFDNAPLAEDDINVTEINIPVTGNVLTNDTDPNPDDALAIVNPATGSASTGAVTLTTSGGGSVVINSDGSYVYTPAAGFSGEDTFSYTVTDENGNIDEANVSIEVRDRNVPVDPSDPNSAYNASPIASDDTFTLFEGVPCLLYTSPSPRDS